MRLLCQSTLEAWQSSSAHWAECSGGEVPDNSLRYDGSLIEFFAQIHFTHQNKIIYLLSRCRFSRYLNSLVGQAIIQHQGHRVV